MSVSWTTIPRSIRVSPTLRPLAQLHDPRSCLPLHNSSICKGRCCKNIVALEGIAAQNIHNDHANTDTGSGILLLVVFLFGLRQLGSLHVDFHPGNSQYRPLSLRRLAERITWQ